MINVTQDNEMIYVGREFMTYERFSNIEGLMFYSRLPVQQNIVSILTSFESFYRRLDTLSDLRKAKKRSNQLLCLLQITNIAIKMKEMANLKPIQTNSKDWLKLKRDMFAWFNDYVENSE